MLLYTLSCTCICVFVLDEPCPTNRPTQLSLSLDSFALAFFFFVFLIRAIVGMSTLFFSKFPYNYTHRPLSFFVFHVWLDFRHHQLLGINSRLYIMYSVWCKRRLKLELVTYVELLNELNFLFISSSKDKKQFRNVALLFQLKWSHSIQLFFRSFRWNTADHYESYNII